MQNVLQRITGRVSAMSSENFITPYKKGDFIGQKYVPLNKSVTFFTFFTYIYVPLQ